MYHHFVLEVLPRVILLKPFLDADTKLLLFGSAHEAKWLEELGIPASQVSGRKTCCWASCHPGCAAEISAEQCLRCGEKQVCALVSFENLKSRQGTRWADKM